MKNEKSKGTDFEELYAKINSEYEKLLEHRRDLVNQLAGPFPPKNPDVIAKLMDHNTHLIGILKQQLFELDIRMIEFQ